MISKVEELPNIPQKIYASQLVTVNDLQELRKSIVNDLFIALKPSLKQPMKKWLQSYEVRKMLKISPGTLQTLKNNRTIKYSKIEGIHFFDLEEIQMILRG